MRILPSALLAALCFLQCSSTDDDLPASPYDYALTQSLKYSGLELSAKSRKAALATASTVDVKDYYPLDSAGNRVMKRAWRLVFNNVSLMGPDTNIYKRDYEVLIDTLTGYLLMIRSPAIEEEIYRYTRDDAKPPADDWHRPSGLVPDTGIITFAEAIIACRKSNPLTARQIEAAVEWDGVPGKSARVWDIVIRDPGDVPHYSKKGPVPRDSIAFEAYLAREKTRRCVYVRQPVNAVSGASGSLEALWEYDDTLRAEKE